MLAGCLNEDTLGPGVKGCRDDFDFTIKFEQLVFSVLPSVLLIVASIWRVRYLSTSVVVVHAPLLQSLKLALILVYTIVHSAGLVLAGLGVLSVASWTLPAASLLVIGGICMAVLSLFEHGRTTRPSIILGLYLPLTTLLDIAHTRTLWLVSTTGLESSYASLFTASVTLKAAILIVEAQNKGKWIEKLPKGSRSPEETSGIYSLGAYFWLNRLFVTGYRKILQVSDLYPLDQEMTSLCLQARFKRNSDYSKMKGHKYGLAKATALTLWPNILFSIPPRIALIVFTFCQPLMINSVLKRLEAPPSPNSKNDGYGFIAATALIYAGISFSTALYWYFHYRTLMMMRGILVNAIYVKTTELKVEPGDLSASITLMSVDIERIVQGFANLHESWAAGIEVAIASWLLYNKLGIVFVVPMAVVFACFLALSVLVRFTGDTQKAWMSAVQKRTGLTASIIASMKSIKISGVAGPIADIVQSLRVSELKAGSRYRRLNLIGTFLAFGPLLVSPFLTFAIAHRNLNTTTIFTSLSYLLLLATPLTVFIKAIPLIAAGLACFSRIQTFLERDIRIDPRLISGSTRHYTDVEPLPTDSVDPTEAKAAVTIKEGNFGWEEKDFVLNDINVQFPQSGLTLMVGPVAAGKSTLCRAILGEVPHSYGTMEFGRQIGRVGYCDQNVFLFNSTIRENIVGSCSYDAERYAGVINATMLGVDLNVLPLGDATVVGSNGISLSGGQRQRIALARALYIDSDILVLDDVFSGLDADTEEQVFQRVFGSNGICKTRNTTVVLCTHSVRHLPYADHIIALNAAGMVSQQGSFEQLMTTKGYVQDLQIKASNKESGAKDTLDENEVPAKEDSLQLAERPTSSSPATEKSTTDASGVARQLGDRSVYKHYFKSMGLPLAGSMFWFAAQFGFFYNFPTIWLKFWSDDTDQHTPKHSFGFYVGIYAFLQLACLLSILGLGQLIWVMSIKRAGASLHKEILRTLITAPLRFLTTTDQGVLTNLFSQDLNLIDTELPNALLNVFYNISVAIGQAAVLVTTSMYIAATYPFLLALVWLIQKFYLRTSRQLRLLDLEVKSPLYTHFLDTAKGIVTLRAFGTLSEERAKSLELLDRSQRPFYLLIVAQQWLTLVLNLIVMVIAVILVSLALELKTNSGFTGASLVTLMSFGDILSSIVMQWTKLETSVGAIARLKTFNETVKSENKEDEVIIPDEGWPYNGHIELINVSASYENPDECKEETALALCQLNISVAAGEKVAICGRTGSGKSSIIAFLLKLIDPVRDTLCKSHIDGTPLHRINREALRLRLIALPQDPVSLSDTSTFRENLDPFGIAGVHQCRAALETVGLWGVVKERGGLDALMDSTTFSLGQRQLFSLAHAVLRRRSRTSQGGILLLDEVSSSVDQETERLMQSIIRDEFKSYTIVAVSHRLDMIMDFDKVIVMDKSSVIEIGKPTDLVQEKHSRFGDLYRSAGESSTA